MAAHEDEDDLLRSVALQNVKSILRAREQAERELAAERERLRITLASIGDGVIAADAAGRVKSLNPVAQALTGWTEADAAGQPLDVVFRIVNERSRRPVENPALRALREGHVVGLANHTILIARDGSEHAIDDSAAPIRGAQGDTCGAVLIFRDITERKRAEFTQARLAAIVESSQDAIVSKSLDGTIRTWNAGAERIFGYAAAAAVGRHITLIVPPERQDEELEILARIGRGDRVEHFDTERVTKAGRKIAVSLTISPVRDSTGRIVGASKVARDITDRKQAEAELREADRRKNEFIALLAHELRNPLAPLRNGLQAIRLAAEGGAAAPAWSMMDRQLGHMVRLIDDFLDISRVNQNKMELRRAPVALGEVVGSAVETARPAIEAARHAFSVSLPPDAVTLDADHTRLAQVVSNLLTNSAKYTEPGGRIWLSAERRGDNVVVAVRDTGLGIPAESLPRIFDMFSQVDRSVERSTGGLGIGLALVKGLVEMHGGTVTAESPGQGQGSTFQVTLPVMTSATPRATSGPVDAVMAAGPRRRILVVDDNRDSADSMAMMLNLLGEEVRTAHDGVAAVAEAEAFRPQIILMDVGMPRLNGYEATRRIRDQPWGRSPIILALTGWGQDGDRTQSQLAGCDGHLVKPVELADLQATLHRLEADRPSAAG